MPVVLAAGIILALLLITICALLFTSGVFYKIEAKIEEPPIISTSFLFAYKTYTGSYDGVGFLYTDAYSVHPNCNQCGIYYDDALKVSKDNCRCAVGSLLPDDADFKQSFESHGFQVANLPPVHKAVVASFPHISFLSIHIALRRVYPYLRSFIKKRDLNVKVFVELYDKDTIYFIGILDHPDDYYVPGIKPTSEHEQQEEEPDVAANEMLDSVMDIIGPEEDFDASFEKLTEAQFSEAGST